MDVYEDLGRLIEDHKEMADAASTIAGCYEHTGRRWAYDHAQDLVEFLRWRDPAKEWPADGCRCLVVVDGKDPLFGQQNRGPLVTMASNVARIESTARWRYVLGPCSCGTAGTEGA